MLGAAVEPLYCEPDGEFPNHHPDPTVAENVVDLAAAVRRLGADVGIGLDGDGDRVGVVDERGEIVVGDRLFIDSGAAGSGAKSRRMCDW